MLNTKSNNKYLSNPLYRSFSLHDHQQRLSMQQQKQNELSNQVLFPAFGSKTVTSSSSSQSNISNDDAKASENKNIDTVKQSTVIINDFPLSLTVYQISPNSVQLKKNAKVEDVFKKVAISLGGNIDYKKGRISANLPNVTITAAIFKDSSTGIYFVDFNRNDGCPFQYTYMYYKVLLESSSYLEIDLEYTKKKLAESEKKLKMWSFSVIDENKYNLTEESNAILLNQA